VTIPAGGSVIIRPPAGFTPTDLVIFTATGGFTIFDPPTATTSMTIQLPCAADGTQVWGYQFFGATDYGPVFANAPLTMNGFDDNGFPRIETAKTDANGKPVLNTSGGHCFEGTGTTVLADPATRTVLPEFAPKTNGSVCLEMTFSDVTATTVTAVDGAKK
jgi:hypothetical protein